MRFPERCSADFSSQRFYPGEKHTNTGETDRQTGGQVDGVMDGQTVNPTSVLKVAAVWRKSSQISCIPSVSQVEFSRQEKNPQPTATASFKHLATSAANRRTFSTGQQPIHIFIGD